MKNSTFPISFLLVFVIEIAALAYFATWDGDYWQDAVLVNEAVWSVQNDWHNMESHQNHTGLDYTVMDLEGTVLFGTKRGLSESINMAVGHRDTILDLVVDNSIVGKIIIFNNTAQIFESQKQTIVMILFATILVQCCFCIAYHFYLNRTIVRPFQKLKGFAERIAGGNLDIPLEMDRQNLFGAFTESFDIMRSELKKAREAEAVANASKKELVAKLSHDIKTPVASIKAASEVGAALTDNEKIRDNYGQIIRKADQINELITNLFTATLEELRQLPVSPEDMESKELPSLLENADYLHRAEIPVIPDCIFYADKLRLQQVFDNIFANSYKYANTSIFIEATLVNDYLSISIEDYGGGVNREELPLLKEKFKRGSNAKNVEGTGLGLYISDYFMEKMNGKLILTNESRGLRGTVLIPLSGRI